MKSEDIIEYEEGSSTIDKVDDEEELTHEEQLVAEKDKYLRLLAEFENYKKRVAKERAELKPLIVGEVWKDIFPVLDNLQLSLKSSVSGEDFHKGIKITVSHLLKVLQDDEINQISCLNQTFDHEIHVAVAELPTDDSSKNGVIIEEMSPLYTCGSRVLKPANVIVGKFNC